MSRLAWMFPLVLLGCHSSPASHPPDASGMRTIVPAGPSCPSPWECTARCTKGDGPACMWAGRAYEYGRDVSMDLAKAHALYERSCELGFGGGCYNQAILLETGRGVAEDTHRAAQVYRKVCAMGSQVACDRAVALQ